MKYAELADKKTIQDTIDALKRNGFDAYFVENREVAKAKIMEMIPENTEVMTMTSTTLDETGIKRDLEDSDKIDFVRKRFDKLSDKQKTQIGAAPEYTVGSFHAVTKNGEIMIASATGSQLPAYAYGSKKVIFVAGTHKIVKDIDEAKRRIHDYVFPLEDARAMKAYGSHSGINKILILNKEVQKNRITIIFVNEILGF